MTQSLLEQVKTSSSWKQAFAQRFMVSFCSVLAIGLTATAAVRAASANEPAVRYVDDGQTTAVLAAPAVAKVTDTPVVVEKPLATAADLMRPVSATAQQQQQKPAPTFASISRPVSKQLSRSRTIRMTVTAYCPCKACCGRNAQGITASGKRVTYNGGKFVAADVDLLPFGTKLSIPGYHDGVPVPVIDTGSAIEGRRLDVFFRTHREAKEWGVQVVDVTVTDERQ